MTYDEKKSLYESIMKDVAKIVIRQINEAYSESYHTKYRKVYGAIEYIFWGNRNNKYKDDNFKGIIGDCKLSKKAESDLISTFNHIAEDTYMIYEQTNTLSLRDFKDVCKKWGINVCFQRSVMDKEFPMIGSYKKQAEIGSIVNLANSVVKLEDRIDY